MSEDDWSDYESPPRCRHWREAGDCDERCAACGHACWRHGDEGCEGCECPCWVEKAD